MQELADLAGVSRGTVSRALSDSLRVNKATKTKIHALAEKHNYRVNRKARNFRLGKTGVVSVVFMLDADTTHMSDPFFLEILGSIADCLAEHDHDVLLAHSPVSNVLDLVNGSVFEFSDGVIFIGQGKQHTQLNQIAAMDKPVVVWGAPMPDQLYSTVGSDNYQGGYLATSHLIEQGRRRIAYLGGDIQVPETALRYAGYSEALNDNGITDDKDLQLQVPAEMASVDKKIRSILSAGASFDALMCSSDLMALAAISAINDFGLTVPSDIAVVGYDDIGIAKYSSPSLTTIRQDTLQGGRTLVETLINNPTGERSSKTILPCELIVRQSSGHAK